MYLFLVNILSNIILEGPVSPEIKEKYKDKIQIKVTKDKIFSLKSFNNLIKIESENEIEKTFNFINKIDPIPLNISEIINNLIKKKELPNKLELIKTGQIDFIIQFIENSNEISNSFKFNIPVLYSTNKEVAKKLNTPFPGFLGFNALESCLYELPLKIYDNINSLENIINYISLPLLGIINHENIIKYETVKMPIFYMLIKKNTENELKEELKSLSFQYKNELKIGFIEYNDSSHAHKSMSTEDQLPTTIIQIKGEKVYLHNSTKKTINKFIKDYKEGKLEPPVKEEKPIDNTNRIIKKAVRENADKLIKNKEKDTLVVFYAHWCGYCKTFMPELEELGKKLIKHKTLDIIKVDLALNHLPQYQVSHYPFIRLYKAKTNEEIDFTGTRNNIEISKFINENSHYKYNIMEVDIQVGEEKVDL